MRRTLWVLVGAVVLAGCGHPDDDAHTVGAKSSYPLVDKTDLKVGTAWSVKVCGLRLMKNGHTELVPNALPAFNAGAPVSGDIVPSSPTAVAVCPTNFEFPGGIPIEITGKSLVSLTDTLNAGTRWDPRAGCATTEGWQRLLVFKFVNGRILAVLMDSSGCGKADSGAQQRVDAWAESWDSTLERLTR